MLKGGAGQYTLRLSRALAASGFKSTVVVAEGPVNDEGVLLLDSENSLLRGIYARFIRSLSHRIALSTYQTVRGPELYKLPVLIQSSDIVHLHGLTGWIGATGLRRMIPAGAKVFQTAHGPWAVSGGCIVQAGTSCHQFKNCCTNCPVLGLPWKRVAMLELRAKKALVEAFDIQPISNSKWMKTILHESYLFNNIAHIPIIPPIVDERYFTPSKNSIRKDLSISEDRLVLSLGALSTTDPFKGIPEFLNSLSKHEELCEKTTVLLFGEGSIPIPDNLDVRDFGAITDCARMAQIYGGSDLFISPSKLESFGMTVLEAQATGVPVIGFNVGGVCEAVWPENIDYLVPAGRWDLLLDKISSACLEKSRHNKSRHELVRWVQKSFSSAAIAEKQMWCYTNQA